MGKLHGLLTQLVPLPLPKRFHCACECGADATKFMPHVYLVNRALTSVNLCDNYLEAEGAKVVAKVLPQCEYVV